jgi:uncharacterized damage-inducible protein DinB
MEGAGMSFVETVLPEFDSEMASTRRLLERVPADRFAWKPHAKSRSLLELATHIGELPRWGMRLEKDGFTIGSEKAPVHANTADLLARFDENVKSGREGLARIKDESLSRDFAVLKPSGEVFFHGPRQSLLRSVLVSHLVHHRGQLTVYLRLCDVPLPSVYGPTADVPM